MTTEFVLLLSIFVFVTAGAFFGKSGPLAAFQTSGPRLGARVEMQLSTGRGFKKAGAIDEWLAPDSKDFNPWGGP
jgi:hypothetical protein